MGRKTFESLPKGALPNRRNVVLSRQEGLQIENAEVYPTLEEALSQCKDEDCFIIGGASVYAQALPLADRLFITEVDDTTKEADTFFPEIDKETWKVVAREDFPTDEKHAYPYSFVDYERR